MVVAGQEAQTAETRRDTADANMRSLKSLSRTGRTRRCLLLDSTGILPHTRGFFWMGRPAAEMLLPVTTLARAEDITTCTQAG